MKTGLIDKWSIVAAIATLIFSFFLFYSYSSESRFSFAAALLAAGLVWLAYIVVRWLALAFR